MSDTFGPIVWREDTLFLLDQRNLPHSEDYLPINDLPQTISAIKDMVVRGAPCIGFTAIFGLALWVNKQHEITLENSRKACDDLISARPTAVNLSFEVNRCFDIISHLLNEGRDKEYIHRYLVHLGQQELQKSHEKNTRMATIAFEELIRTVGDRKWRLMTHCNTGFLACGSIGTALGVISFAHQKGRVEHVIADETRPYMQGTRLTAFELQKEGIPFSLAVEGAASFLLSNKYVDAIFVGADRIALNGDTANKVGTSSLAIIAHHYKIPFYVVAPVSSFDLSISDGSHIEIEMRPEEEITEIKGIKIAPENSKAINPSFDVTDHRLITGIICEKGLIDPSITGCLERVVNS